MKILKKILKWFFISIIIIVLGIILFRNELFILVVKMDYSSKMKRPVEMLNLPIINDSTYNTLASDFDQNYNTPHEYVVKEFENHDIILLGEYHRIKQDVVFVQELIPYLYKAGVKDMAYEFLLNKDSTLIKQVILNREYFDQEKANRLLFNLNPLMGFKECIDILKAAWLFNKNLPEGTDPFMIHGIMHEVDFSVFKTQAELDKIDTGENSQELMIKFRKGVDNPDGFMANCIINDLVRNNKKALVYCGMHHAFTGYKGHGERMGTIVKDSIGDLAMTISLHSPWRAKKGSDHTWIYPVDGCLDAFVRKHKSKDFAFGINVKNTAFGKLADTTSNFIYGDDFTLDDFCDGYIYLNAISSIEGVTTQKRFINWSNIREAKERFPNVEMRDGILRFIGAKGYNYIIGIDPANLDYRFKHLY